MLRKDNRHYFPIRMHISRFSENTLLVCAAMCLFFLLSGCSTLLTTKDEDKIGTIKDAFPVLPIKKQQNTDIAIFEQGRNPKAMQWLRSSTKSLEKGKWSESISAANEAISIEPALYDAYIMRGLAYLKRDSFDRAIADCSEAITINAASALAFACRGTALLKKEDPVRGHADLDKARTLAKATTSHVNTGDRDEEVARYGAACVTGVTFGCTQYKNMVGYLPILVQWRIMKLNREGTKLVAAKNWDGAIDKASEALRIDEQNMTALCNRSGALANKGMIKEARADADAAVSLHPSSPMAFNSRGLVRELSSEREDALSDYETACTKGLKIGCTNALRLKKQTGVK